MEVGVLAMAVVVLGVGGVKGGCGGAGGGVGGHLWRRSVEDEWDGG